MWRIIETATLQSRGRFRPLSAFTLLPVLLMAVWTPWHPAEAEPLCGELSSPHGGEFLRCNDPAGVMMHATWTSATEGTDATIDFEVSLSKPHPELVVRVRWSTQARGTATAGEDYTAASGWLYFEVGETTKTISIPLLDDSVSEGVRRSICPPVA